MATYKVRCKVSSLFLNDIVHHAGDCIIAAEEDLDHIKPYVEVMHPVEEILEAIEEVVDPLAQKIKGKRGKAKTDPTEETSLGSVTIDTPLGSAEAEIVTDIQV